MHVTMQAFTIPLGSPPTTTPCSPAGVLQLEVVAVWLAAHICIHLRWGPELHTRTGGDEGVQGRSSSQGPRALGWGVVQGLWRMGVKVLCTVQRSTPGLVQAIV